MSPKRSKVAIDSNFEEPLMKLAEIKERLRRSGEKLLKYATEGVNKNELCDLNDTSDCIQQVKLVLSKLQMTTRSKRAKAETNCAINSLLESAQYLSTVARKCFHSFSGPDASTQASNSFLGAERLDGSLKDHKLSKEVKKSPQKEKPIVKNEETIKDETANNNNKYPRKINCNINKICTANSKKISNEKISKDCTIEFESLRDCVSTVIIHSASNSSIEKKHAINSFHSTKPRAFNDSQTCLSQHCSQESIIENSFLIDPPALNLKNTLKNVKQFKSKFTPRANQKKPNSTAFADKKQMCKIKDPNIKQAKRLRSVDSKHQRLKATDERNTPICEKGKNCDYFQAGSSLPNITLLFPGSESSSESQEEYKEHRPDSIDRNQLSTQIITSHDQTKNSAMQLPNNNTEMIANTEQIDNTNLHQRKFPIESSNMTTADFTWPIFEENDDLSWDWSRCYDQLDHCIDENGGTDELELPPHPVDTSNEKQHQEISIQLNRDSHDLFLINNSLGPMGPTAVNIPASANLLNGHEASEITILKSLGEITEQPRQEPSTINYQSQSISTTEQAKMDFKYKETYEASAFPYVDEPQSNPQTRETTIAQKDGKKSESWTGITSENMFGLRNDQVPQISQYNSNHVSSHHEMKKKDKIDTNQNNIPLNGITNSCSNDTFQHEEQFLQTHVYDVEECDLRQEKAQETSINEEPSSFVDTSSLPTKSDLSSSIYRKQRCLSQTRPITNNGPQNEFHSQAKQNNASQRFLKPSPHQAKHQPGTSRIQPFPTSPHHLNSIPRHPSTFQSKIEPKSPIFLSFTSNKDTNQHSKSNNSLTIESLTGNDPADASINYSWPLVHTSEDKKESASNDLSPNLEQDNFKKVNSTELGNREQSSKRIYNRIINKTLSSLPTTTNNTFTISSNNSQAEPGNLFHRTVVNHAHELLEAGSTINSKKMNNQWGTDCAQLQIVDVDAVSCSSNLSYSLGKKKVTNNKSAPIKRRRCTSDSEIWENDRGKLKQMDNCNQVVNACLNENSKCGARFDLKCNKTSRTSTNSKESNLVKRANEGTINRELISNLTSSTNISTNTQNEQFNESVSDQNNKATPNVISNPLNPQYEQQTSEDILKRIEFVRQIPESELIEASNIDELINDQTFVW